MRVIVVILVVFALFAPLAAWQIGLSKKHQRKMNPPALSPGGVALARVSLDMARVLEDIRRDPTLIGSSEWKEDADRVLRSYYGDNN